MSAVIQNEDLVAELASLLGAANVLFGDNAQRYEEEWRARKRGKALAVARPGNTEEVVEAEEGTDDE